MAAGTKQHKAGQPTAPGTNLPASEPEAVAVDNMTLQTELEPAPDALDKIEQDNVVEIAKQNGSDLHLSPWDRLAMQIASAAAEYGRPITQVKAAAVSWVPEEKDKAIEYAKAFKRMRAILEILDSEVSAVVGMRFGT